MVELTRAHPRLKEAQPPGRREALPLGTLFLPAALATKRATTPLFVHFHGGTWLPEVAAATVGRTAAITIQLGSGSSAYAKPFADPKLFERVIAEAETRAMTRFAPITLSSWSAGYGAVREILKEPGHYGRVDRVLLIEACTPDTSAENPGRHRAVIRNRDGAPPDLPAVCPRRGGRTQADDRDALGDFSGTYASTTETADWLLRQLGLKRTAVVRWGPMGTQQLSEARSGRLSVIGFAGNTAPDHVDQLHSLADYLKWFK